MLLSLPLKQALQFVGISLALNFAKQPHETPQQTLLAFPFLPHRSSYTLNDVLYHAAAATVVALGGNVLPGHAGTVVQSMRLPLAGLLGAGLAAERGALRAAAHLMELAPGGQVSVSGLFVQVQPWQHAWCRSVDAALQSPVVCHIPHAMRMPACCSCLGVLECMWYPNCMIIGAAAAGSSVEYMQ